MSRNAIICNGGKQEHKNSALFCTESESKEKSRKMFSAQINYDLFYVNMVNELTKKEKAKNTLFASFRLGFP